MHSYSTHTLHWRGLVIEARYCPSWSPGYRASFGYDLAHLEVDAQPTPLPFTATGYRSHFDRADNIEAAGGPVAFVLAWLEDAARAKSWRAQEAEQAQLTLF